MNPFAIEDGKEIKLLSKKFKETKVSKAMNIRYAITLNSLIFKIRISFSLKRKQKKIVIEDEDDLDELLKTMKDSSMVRQIVSNDFYQLNSFIMGGKETETMSTSWQTLRDNGERRIRQSGMRGK